MVEVLSVVAIVVSCLTVVAIVILAMHLSAKVQLNLSDIGANKNAIGKNEKRLESNEKAIHDMEVAIEDIKIELATAKAMMFAYEAKLRGEQGVWCLEYEGNKKWYAPGVLLRTESADGHNVTEFSYDESNGNVSAISRFKNKLISAITFSKFGKPMVGKVYSNGVVSKEIKYDKLGQVIK